MAWNIAYPAGWTVNGASIHESAPELRGAHEGRSYRIGLSYPIGIAAPRLETWIATELAGLSPSSARRSGRARSLLRLCLARRGRGSSGSARARVAHATQLEESCYALILTPTPLGGSLPEKVHLEYQARSPSPGGHSPCATCSTSGLPG